MSTEKTQNLKFTLFDITCKDSRLDDIQLGRRLFLSLEKTNKVKDRLIHLNEEESDDVDLITKYSYEKNTGFFYGVFIRLKQGKDSILKTEDLEKDTVELSEIIANSKNESAGTVKSMCFFGIKDDLIVITHARNNKKYLNIYIRTLIEKYLADDRIFEFTKKLKTNNTLPLSEIGSIRIADSAYINALVPNSSTNYNAVKRKLMTKIKTVGIDLVKDIFKGSGLEDNELDKLVSAFLVLKFNSKELKKQEALQAAMTLIDDDSIVVYGKNGVNYRGSSFVIQEDEKIELLGDGVFSEIAIMRKMKDMLSYK